MNWPRIILDGLSMSLLFNAVVGLGFLLVPQAYSTMFPKELGISRIRLLYGLSMGGANALNFLYKCGRPEVYRVYVEDMLTVCKDLQDVTSDTVTDTCTNQPLEAIPAALLTAWVCTLF